MKWLGNLARKIGTMYSCIDHYGDQGLRFWYCVWVWIDVYKCKNTWTLFKRAIHGMQSGDEEYH